jgi:hypothetical protein
VAAARPRRQTDKPAHPAEQVNKEAPQRARSLVFVSHDSRDFALAESFSNLLSDVSGGILKSFRSSDKRGTSGIEFGAEWYTEIMSKIGDASDVVALLTPNSLDRPWILYEAGVAKGKLDVTVFGVALGVPLERVSTGPFGQFQNCDGDEDSLTKLVVQLLNRNPDAAPREEAIRRQVKSFRDGVTELLTSNGTPTEAEEEDDNAARLFEEIKAMVRELPARMEGRIRTSGRSSILRRVSRRSPGMFEELVMSSRYMMPSSSSASDSWLIFVSLLKDDCPWLYEKGMEIYRTVRSGRPLESALDEFIMMVEFSFRSPLGEMMFDKELGPLPRFIPDLAGRLAMDLHHEQETIAAKKKTKKMVAL